MKSPNSPADAVRPAFPDNLGRSLEGEKERLVAKRSEDVGGAHPTTAWPLALAAVCLMVYASLYPFSDWRDQGISPLRFLSAPLPQYWTRFDVGANLLGYAPLGFLLALSALRSLSGIWAISTAVLGAALLSLAMETMQSYLPSRIPSNLDLALNTLGGLLGAACAWVAQKTGVVDSWGRFRSRWFDQDARGALVLLMLWPVALLFPASVPMGLGQVFERLEFALTEVLTDTPFLEWLPLREVELQPLVPIVVLLCVALGALVPCLLGYCVIRTMWKRAAFSAVMLGTGLAASALSAALSYGPDHAWAWLDLPVRAGLGLALLLVLLLLAVPRRAAAALTLLALAVHLGLLNQAPADPYFAQTLQTWEQGRFIRFHGVVQWLGWIWPYATLLYVLLRLSGREKRVLPAKT